MSVQLKAPEIVGYECRAGHIVDISKGTDPPKKCEHQEFGYYVECGKKVTHAVLRAKII
jgi:hypothetical protein